MDSVEFNGINSLNIFNPSSKQFAFYSFDDGFGWVDDSGDVIYDNKMQKVLGNSLPASSGEVKSGKAYLQLLMDEYISFSGK